MSTIKVLHNRKVKYRKKLGVTTLIVMARWAYPGRCKSRLSSDFQHIVGHKGGIEKSAIIQRAIILWTR